MLYIVHGCVMVVSMPMVMVMIVLVMMFMFVVMLMVVLMMVFVVMLMVVLMMVFMVMFMFVMVLMNVFGFFLFTVYQHFHVSTHYPAFNGLFFYEFNFRYTQPVKFFHYFIHVREKLRKRSCQHVSCSTHTTVNI